MAYSQRSNGPLCRKAETRGGITYCLGNEGGREVPVMLFDHAGTGMPQVLGHNEQRRAVHDGKRRPSVPENVKADCWLDAGRFAGRLHRADLPGLSPCCAVVPREQEAIGALADCKAAENLAPSPLSTT